MPIFCDLNHIRSPTTGTAKTTICTSVASFLGWSFVTIDTSSFLANGMENVASRMSYIFERLKALEKTIVLFDEIEEFCLDRENPALGMESRLLTTAMLTNLNELRRRQASIFIVATNRLRAFDAAVIRPGRFDLLLFVGTPNLAARSTRLQAQLDGTLMGPLDAARHHAVAVAFMADHWREMRFLTFAEGEAFAKTTLDLALRDALTHDALDAALTGILRTATIQSQVKEEYLASESLSRV